MTEPEKQPHEPNAARPQRKGFGVLYVIGLPLMILGIVITVMMTMNHLKQQPPEPLDIDLTMRFGYGGIIVYGVAAAILGFILMLIDVRRRKA